jgi:hypothetical protein
LTVDSKYLLKIPSEIEVVSNKMKKIADLEPSLNQSITFPFPT